MATTTHRERSNGKCHTWRDSLMREIRSKGACSEKILIALVAVSFVRRVTSMGQSGNQTQPQQLCCSLLLIDSLKARLECQRACEPGDKTLNTKPKIFRLRGCMLRELPGKLQAKTKKRSAMIDELCCDFRMLRGQAFIQRTTSVFLFIDRPLNAFGVCSVNNHSIRHIRSLSTTDSPTIHALRR